MKERFTEHFIDEYDCKRSISILLTACLNHCEDSSLDFVKSLHNFYNKKGYLTDNQIEALLKIEKYSLK